MDRLVEMIQRAESQGKLVDVTYMDENVCGARIVSKPTKDNKIFDEILLATTQ